MSRLFLGICLVLNVALFTNASGQNLYDINTLQKIEIWFSQPNWDYQMDTAKHGSESYLMADWVKVNGAQYDSVGIKYKGNSSYDSTRFKNPLNIAFDEFKDQKHQAYTNIKLSNAYGDPSFLREVLAYAILGNYMHCPMANFAQVYINGTYYGLYSSAENIDKKFCGDHFYTNYGTFIKCNPTISPSPTIKSNLKYINADSSSYSQLYEIKSKSGWNELVKLCDSTTNHAGSIHSFMDVDRAIWMLAYNNLMINLDSYNGVFAQNYYVYKDKTNHYNPIIWDLNMCFGAFPFAGAGTSSMGTLNISGMQQFSALNHETDPNWPLINAIQSNATFKRMYFAHMRTMINEQLANGAYKTLTTQLRSIIDTAVQSDLNGFFTYSQYSNSTNTDYPFGSYTVPGLYNLMDSRASYLLATPELSATPPSIMNVTSSSSNPNYGASFNITASITNTNASAVWLGSRSDKTVKFVRTLMYDDGAHNDGAAGDNIYGATLTMNAGFIQYYIYAENSNAGIFSPERAEHEFHSVFANSIEPSIGDLVINEILAENNNNVKDEYNDTEDWIELYNRTSQVLNLTNTYLATKSSNLSKWKFPEHTTILPNSYLTIWADDDSTQQVLHTNFGMNKQADTLYLSRNGSILDSVTFANQQADTSYGRYPNGTGAFIQMNTTYNGENNNFPLSTVSTQLAYDFQVSPIPANTFFIVECPGNRDIQIYNTSGQLMFHSSVSDELKVDCSKWASGVYFLHIDKTYKAISIAR